MNGVLGVILAGGLSRRMGGGDKCLREIGGLSLLARVRDRLAPQCARLLLSANGDPARFAEFGIEVVADPVPDHPGPLGGVLAGLEWARAHAPELPHTVTAAADTPFFPESLVADLRGAAEREGHPVAVAAVDDGTGLREHPVFGFWPVALAGPLRSALVEHGVRKILDWADAQGCARAVFPAGERDPFFNVNTPEDLVASARLLGVAA